MASRPPCSGAPSGASLQPPWSLSHRHVDGGAGAAGCRAGARPVRQPYGQVRRSGASCLFRRLARSRASNVVVCAVTVVSCDSSAVWAQVCPGSARTLPGPSRLRHSLSGVSHLASRPVSPFGARRCVTLCDRGLAEIFTCIGTELRRRNSFSSKPFCGLCQAAHESLTRRLQQHRAGPRGAAAGVAWRTQTDAVCDSSAVMHSDQCVH